MNTGFKCGVQVCGWREAERGQLVPPEALNLRAEGCLLRRKGTGVLDTSKAACDS